MRRGEGQIELAREEAQAVRQVLDDDGADREALLEEACASGRMLESSCARALAAAAAG